ncbi:hypothetical protein [Aquirufa regiilacus]|uniref:Uncharacterized protein n=1 Tax=Aquirufa regiilacus TaxID=3024868 RepID=A0ABU3TQ18_9BACT|nr:MULTISPECIES: hypothetical protein [unclassified Aquirufa]MDT8887365.1 hypothetical protein [Aquirufa sp. LEPPI-3A]MDU0807961.1 hypothetical protein [Aquirufa sp. LEOWEIH-7C]
MEPREFFKIIIFLFSFLPNLNGQKLEYNSVKGLQTFKFNDQNRTAPFSYVGKRNSEYETHGFETLEYDLAENVPIPDDILCRKNMAIFVFKVNHKSEIEELIYNGDLDTLVEQKIKQNIRETTHMYNLPSSQTSEQFHWFIFPFFSDGGMLDYQSCPNAEKLKIESHHEFELYLLTQNLRKILPEFKSLTILQVMGHFSEMSKKGMLKYDKM